MLLPPASAIRSLTKLPGPTLKDFVASGTQIAWIIDPESVEVCHSATQRKLIGSGALLEGEHLLPGFQFPIASLFKDWDWE